MDEPDPATWSAKSWQARLAALKSRYASEKDPRVIECRKMLAYHRISKAIEIEASQLSPAGIDLLIAQLKEATPR